MPIKDENKGKYPANWKEIRAGILKRAAGRCECTGECGLHTTTGRCIEMNGSPAKFAKGKVVLTVAHLNHVESDCRPENLKAMCQRCHLRYDVEHHRQSARQTRRKKKNTMEMFE